VASRRFLSERICSCRLFWAAFRGWSLPGFLERYPWRHVVSLGVSVACTYDGVGCSALGMPRRGTTEGAANQMARGLDHRDVGKYDSYQTSRTYYL